MLKEFFTKVHLSANNPEEAAKTKGFRGPSLREDLTHARHLGTT